MALQTANISASTLDGGINDSVTSLDVVSAASFPTGGDFWIRIDDEIMKVTGVSSNTFTVVRGESGGGASAAASHSNGAAVTGVLTSQAITQLRADITRWGTYAQMAALTDMKSGDVFYFDGSDTAYERAVYNGSSWNHYLANGYKATLPVVGDYSWTNQGTSTAVASGGAVLFTVPAAAANMRVLTKAAPSTPYTITAVVANHYPWNGGDVSIGPAWRQSSDGKLVVARFFGTSHALQKWNSATSFNSNYVAQTTINVRPTYFWMRIVDNGTNRIFSVSFNGPVWTQLHSVGRTDFLTADEVGFTAHGGDVAQYQLLSWEQS